MARSTRLPRINTEESIKSTIIATVQAHRLTATNLQVDSRIKHNIANGDLYSVDYDVEEDERTGYVLRRHSEYIFFYNAREVLEEVEKTVLQKSLTLTPDIFAGGIFTIALLATVVLAILQIPIPQLM
jgi:hypothetical protein